MLASNTPKFAIGTAVLLVVALAACDDDNRRLQEEAERKAWTGDCHDESRLLATTAGSPDSFRCSNQRHKMRVQLSSSSSNEEFGALVFCECVSPAADAADPDGGPR